MSAEPKPMIVAGGHCDMWARYRYAILRAVSIMFKNAIVGDRQVVMMRKIHYDRPCAFVNPSPDSKDRGP